MHKSTSPLPEYAAATAVEQTIVVSIDEACAITRSGRSAVYEWLNDGTLEGIKLGRRTVVLYRSILDMIAKAPRLGAGKADEKDGEPA
ncbi:excisionase family DNA binding protein [Bosea sp. BE125]|uniref:helix-turn-helix domain-containing protein n=1 Tax=Bosea sp. BE125 TaxID=2817909 RepID=UPI0028578151|nr:helix-turn-helix domain-containing protein [Bosea sp. BE125]MDR6873548.1 excisionase family DNA binding protein [Bosea sp. BE125]